MNSFLLYILKSTVCISLLYLLFRVLMRKEASFSLNRAMLLAVVAGSMLIPLLYLPQLMQTPIQVELIPEFSGNEIRIQNLPVAEKTESVATLTVNEQTGNKLTIPLEALLKYIYLAGVLIAFVLLIRNIVPVLMLFRKATVKQMDGYRLLITDSEVPSFAFARSVMISRNDYDLHRSSILAHEQAHIRLNHFYDLALLELVKIFHWFNPAVYGLISDMKEIHEFQADDHTLHSGIDATQYQLLIIQKCVGPKRFALANSFNHCQIKKRIAMMNKQKTSKAWRWKVATFLPLLALLLMAFGRTGENVPEKVNLSEKIIEPAEIIQNQNERTNRLIEIRRDGNYIDNKLCSLEEVVKKGQEWQKASNNDILLLVDESVSYGRVDEVREALDHAKVYHVTQSAPNSDEIIYPAGDVSEAAKFTQGKWGDWMKNRLNQLSEGKSNSLEYKITYSFIIDKNGKVSDGHLIQACDQPEINAAAEKMLTQIPDWNPAKKNGVAVNVLYKEIFSNRIKNDGATPPPIFIDIKKEGIYLVKELISLDELEKRAPLFNKSYPEQRVFVGIGIGATQNQIESVKKILRDAGISNIQYSTDIKEKDSPFKK